MASRSSIFLKSGERGIIVGQSGSGKTRGAVWQLRNTGLAPVIVFDTKSEDAFLALPRAIIDSATEGREEMLVVESRDQFAALSYDDLPEYVLVRPSIAELTDPEKLDAYLVVVYEKFKPALVYLDEAYQFHVRGNAGPGLVGLLTRGRSRGIATLIGSQRPAWVSRFAFSEAVRWYVYALSDEKDRARIGEFIPGFEELPRLKLDEHHFYYYHVADERPSEFAPVPLYKALPALIAAKPGRVWL